MLLLVALSLSLLLLCFCVWLFLPFDWRSSGVTDVINLIPGPKPLPLLGNCFHYNIPHDDIPDQIKKDFGTFGPIFRVWLIGRPMVFISDPDDVEVILKSRTEISKSDDYTFLHNLLGLGLLTSTGEKWRTHQKLLQSAFHSRNYDGYIDTFNQNTSILIDKLQSMLDDPWIDLPTWVTLTLLDVISETMFGVRIHAQRDNRLEYVKSLKGTQESFLHRTLSPWLHNPLSYKLSFTGRREAKLIKVLLGFCKQVITEKTTEMENKKKCALLDEDDSVRAGSPTGPPKLLEMLLASKEMDASISDQDILDEVSTFMFAGEDTTTTAICWAAFLLGAHPDIQDKVVEELNEIFGSSDRHPSLADLNDMKYMERVMKEAWRLYPSSPLFSRKLVEGLNLKNYVVPAGTNVYITPFAIHRDPEVFPEPDKFDPDRFLPERAEARHPFAFLPFSAGPRMCIGQRFGHLSEKTFLAAILRNFHVTSLDSPRDLKTKMEVTLRPWPVMRIKLTPRVKKI